MSADLARKCVGSGCEVKDVTEGTIVAVVATLNVVDRDGDVELPGSFPRSSNVKISGYGHGVIVDGAAPAGKGAITVEGDKAILRAKYFMSTHAGREAFHTVMELGSDGEFSFGFPRDVQTAPMTDAWREKGARRLIAKLQPLEASAVFRGAGIGTTLLSAKCVGCGDSHACGCASKTSPEDDFSKARRLIETIRRDASLDPWPLGKKALAERAFRFACAWLGIAEPRPRLRGFLPDGVKSGQLIEDVNEVWIDVSLCEDDLLITAGHELEHLRQYRRGWPYSEAGAETTGRLLLKRWRQAA